MSLASQQKNDNAADVVAAILELFRSRGSSQYGFEAVTQLEHALQSATLGWQQHATSELISAALLHDIGHLLHDLPDDAPDQGIDDHHENVAFHFLKTHFGPETYEPVRLHVAAKRYLCTTREGYLDQLSEPSLVSFRLQGGLMNEAEVKEFEANPHYEAAVELRIWDDTAKVPGLTTPGLEQFEPHLRHAVRSV